MTMMKNLKSVASPAAPPHVDKITDVLSNQLISTHEGGFQEFLVRWQNRLISDATWIAATNF